MSYIIIGWPATPLKCEVVQGNSGVLRIAAGVMKRNGDPLDDYTGWTAVLHVERAGMIGGNNDTINIEVDCEADGAGHRVIADFEFTTALTDAVDPGFYTGTVVFTDPDGEDHKPGGVNLNVKRTPT